MAVSVRSAKVAPPSLPARRTRVVGRLEAAVATAGGALVVLVGRDGSPPWRVARVVLVAALTAVMVLFASHVGGRWRGRAATAVGVLAVAVGSGFTPYLVKDGMSPTSLAAVLLVSVGLGLAIAGVVVATRSRRLLARLGSGAIALVATGIVAFVVGPAVAATNVPRPALGDAPDAVGLDYQTVRLRTDDGVALAAWYVPSTNAAAVVLLHGAGSTRSDVLRPAAVLARHGYGVLLVDARGHGDSDGRAMDFGWYGDADVEAATAFLTERSDIDPNRIGVVGMSMGGEEAIGASAANPAIRAVVAEGATARSASDEAWLSDRFGLRGMFTEKLEVARDWVTDLLTSASPPVSNRAAVALARTTRYLLITAGNEPDEGYAAAHVAAAAPDRVGVWTVADAGHTDGLEVAPEEWERRVIGFLDEALGQGGGGR